MASCPSTPRRASELSSLSSNAEISGLTSSQRSSDLTLGPSFFRAQHVGECFARAVHAALGRGDGDVENGGDVLVRPAFDVAQDERGHQLGAAALQPVQRVQQVQAGAGDDAGGARVGDLGQPI